VSCSADLGNRLLQENGCRDLRQVHRQLKPLQEHLQLLLCQLFLLLLFMLLLRALLAIRSGLLSQARDSVAADTCGGVWEKASAWLKKCAVGQPLRVSCCLCAVVIWTSKTLDSERTDRE
jgi:hypothetical protein